MGKLPAMHVKIMLQKFRNEKKQNLSDASIPKAKD